MLLGKCWKWNLIFQNWSKSLCSGISEPTKRLAPKSTAYALRNWQVKQAFVKENEKKKKTMEKVYSQQLLLNRNIHPEVLCKKCFLKNLPKFTGKSLYQSLLYNKVAA